MCKTAIGAWLCNRLTKAKGRATECESKRKSKNEAKETENWKFYKIYMNTYTYKEINRYRYSCCCVEIFKAKANLMGAKQVNWLSQKHTYIYIYMQL